MSQEDYCISKECKRLLASYMLMYNRIMYIHVCTYLLMLCVCDYYYFILEGSGAIPIQCMYDIIIDHRTCRVHGAVLTKGNDT